MTISTEIILIIVSLIFNLVLLGYLFYWTKRKIAAVPQVSINQTLQSQIDSLVSVNQKQQALLEQNSQSIENILPVLETIDRHATLRYNPFRDAGVGGKQSFSTAMIDKKGNGIILTNLYSREISRVSIKEIQNWQTVEQELSPEEKEVLQKLQN
tara:strand:- start:550 stop:1014 length:465 start_codon:yes stop_codon:yes gene_type:complete